MIRKMLEDKIKMEEFNHLEFNDDKEMVESVLVGLESKSIDGKLYCPCMLKSVECICKTASKKVIEKKGLCHCLLFKLKGK